MIAVKYGRVLLKIQRIHIYHRQKLIEKDLLCIIPQDQNVAVIVLYPISLFYSSTLHLSIYQTKNDGGFFIFGF